MILILCLLTSCLNKTLLRNIDKSEELVTQELIEAISTGDSRKIIEQYKKEAKNLKLGIKMQYHTNQGEYIAVNQPLLLLLAFPKGKINGSSDREDALKYLIDYMKNRKDPNYINPNEIFHNSSLASLITSSCSTSTLEYFLKNAHVNLNTDEVGTLNPLMISIARGEAEKVSLLLKYGASLSITGNAIPVAYACWEGNVDILEIMWKHNQALIAKDPNYKDLFNTVLPFSNSYPSVYAGANCKNQAIRFLISVDAAHYRRKDIRWMWGKKMIASSFINLVAKSLTSSASIFGIIGVNFFAEAIQKSSAEFLKLTIDQVIMEKAQKAFSCIKSEGSWILTLKPEESNFPLAIEGFNKMISSNCVSSKKLELGDLKKEAEQFNKLKIKEPNRKRDSDNFKRIQIQLQVILSKYSIITDSTLDLESISKENTLILNRYEKTSFSQGFQITWKEKDEFQKYFSSGYAIPSFNELKTLATTDKQFNPSGIYWTRDGEDILKNISVFRNGVKDFLPQHFIAELILIKRHD